MIKRLVDETNQLKKIEIETVILLIKQEWMRRLEEDGLSSGAPAEGIMSTMGYRVGDTQGIKQEYRTMIMIEILKGPLPFVESPSYMREWGEDGSLDRYNKLKRFLNGEINSPLQKNNYRAISEWKEDLIWLEDDGLGFINK
ncbi:hypothetical protein N9A12_03005 [Gammaproteobacteria bacterium]|nr:hypothetical protein [Gammaproteobacteria bacterium]